MQRRDLNAPDAYRPVAAYTQAIEVSGDTRTPYISGQIGERMDGTIPEDVVEQSRLAWQNLEAQLKAAGMTLDSLVKVATILTNGGDVVATREARSKAQGDRKPASTLIVSGLANPAWKIEIEGIAVARSGRSSRLQRKTSLAVRGCSRGLSQEGSSAQG